MLAGGAIEDRDRLTSVLGQELHAAIASANGLGPRGGLEVHLAAHYAAEQETILREILDEVPDGDEPTDETAPSRYVLHTAAEAYAPLPPVDWVVDELFARGRTYCLYGDGGTKKTYTAYDAAVAIAAGEADWLDFAVHGGPVLLTDEEAGLNDTLRRLARVMRGHDAPAGIPLTFTSLEAIDLRDTEHTLAIEALLARLRPAFWVIDAFMDVTPGADENARKEIAPPLHLLKRLAVQYDLAVLLIHHSGRDGKKYRGSSAIKQEVDVMLLTESQDESPNIDFVSEKVRDGPPLRFAAAAHFGEDTFHLTRTGQEKPRAKLNKGEREVMYYLTEHGGRAFREAIVYGVESVAVGTAKNAITSLCQRKLIRRCNEGAQGTDAEYEVVGVTEAVPW